MPPDDLAVEMIRSGALIAPTLADEWMLVVNEALQAGLPVIGSIYAQAVTALIEDSRNGWKYEPSSESSLFNALDSYFSASSEQIAAMRWTARESVADRTPQWAAAGAVEAIRSVMGIHTDGKNQINGSLDPSVPQPNQQTTIT